MFRIDLRRERLFHTTVVAVVALLVSFPFSAAAQDGFDVQSFHPMPNQQGNILSSATSEVAPHLQWNAFGVFNFGANPLVLLDENGDRVASIVSSQATFHMMGTIALFERAEVGIDIPLIFFQGGDASPEGSPFDVNGSFGVGDIRLVSKAHIYATERAEDELGFSAGAVLDLHLPSGRSEAMQGGDFRVGPRLVVEALFPAGHRVGSNLGYQYRPASTVGNLAVNDTIGWSVFGEFSLEDDVSIMAEIFGRVTPAGNDRNHSPTELSLGVKSPIGPTYLVGGMGFGLISGYGAPDWRAYLGVGLPM